MIEKFYQIRKPKQFRKRLKKREENEKQLSMRMVYGKETQGQKYIINDKIINGGKKEKKKRIGVADENVFTPKANPAFQISIQLLYLQDGCHLDKNNN